MAKEDLHRSSDNRVRWSDFSGFQDVRLDARHDHKIGRKGKAMKFFLAFLTVIMILECWWLFSPQPNKNLLIIPYSDKEASDAR
jgi:aromatic ring-cleaving dioxygenase